MKLARMPAVRLSVVLFSLCHLGTAVYLRSPGNGSSNITADGRVALKAKSTVIAGSSKNKNDNEKLLEELRKALAEKLEESDKLHGELHELQKEGHLKAKDLDAKAAKLHSAFEAKEKAVQELLLKTNPANKVAVFFMEELHERDLRIDNLGHDIASLHETIEFVEEDLSLVSQQMHAEFSYVHDHLAMTMDEMMGRIIKLENGGDAKTDESEQESDHQAALDDMQHANDSLDVELEMLKAELTHMKELQDKEIAMKNELIKELEEAIAHLEIVEKDLSTGAEASTDGNPFT